MQSSLYSCILKILILPTPRAPNSYPTRLSAQQSKVLGRIFYVENAVAGISASWYRLLQECRLASSISNERPFYNVVGANSH